MNRKLFVIFGLGLSASEAVWAHSPIPGIGNFYNGLLHPLLVPAHVMLLLAVGLFGGQQGTKAIQPILVVYAAAVLAGLIAAWFSIGSDFESVTLVLAAVIGLLVALNPQFTLFGSGLVALLAGFFLGIDSAQETLSGKEKLVTLFGSGIAIYLLVLYPVIVADYCNTRSWQKIAVRIVGSWIAASALLVLALSVSREF